MQQLRSGLPETAELLRLRSYRAQPVNATDERDQQNVSLSFGPRIVNMSAKPNTQIFQIFFDSHHFE